MIRNGIVAGAAALLLAGCGTVGPDYHGPASALPKSSKATGAFVSAEHVPVTDAPLPPDWWRLYQDATLDRLISEALAANSDLRVAAANIRRAEAAHLGIEDERRVQTSVQGGPAYIKPSAIEEVMPGEPIPNVSIYSATAGISYQVDLFGQIERAIAASSAETEAARAAYDATRVTIVADVTRAYLDACSAGREIAIAERSIELQRRSTELTERLVRGGRGSSLDATRSRAQEKQILATLPALAGRRRIAAFRLAVLTGKPPADFAPEVDRCAAEPRLSRPIPVGDGAALLKRRPDIRAAERRLAAAVMRIGVATADLYPHISFGASAGSVGFLENPLSADSFKFSIGPLISWEFPNRDRARARIAGAEAESDAALARFDGAVLTALDETERALSIYGHDLEERAATLAARDEAARAAADADRLFRAGRTGFLTALDAQRTAIAADQQLAAIDTRIARDQVAIFLALGGGWEATNAP
ncbi:RND transporter [Sphingomonas oleivorans]|uniref:RND transporter n=1 Tax=Sphingomonas oleivorans TaxID=1735121 RepID=A0A2T5FXM7_9SPHN|nr:TolC family protein [Sphingomonas oleivorans]PTQ10875.1 RND transporter [Sphingomonas oleivorans]